MYNPSLRQEPRSQRAPVIPLQHEASILDWLERTGRLIARDVHDYDYSDDEEEIVEVLGVDDNSFDLDGDDDEVVELEE